MQCDAQVLDRMLILIEDWARALPQTAFPDALGVLLSSGVRLPERPESEKAPLLDTTQYETARKDQLARLPKSSKPARQRTGASQVACLPRCPLLASIHGRQQH